MPLESPAAGVLQSHKSTAQQLLFLRHFVVFHPPPATVLHPSESQHVFHVQPAQFDLLFIVVASIFEATLRVQVGTENCRTIAPSQTVAHSPCLQLCLRSHSPFLCHRPRRSSVSNPAQVLCSEFSVPTSGRPASHPLRCQCEICWFHTLCLAFLGHLSSRP